MSLFSPFSSWFRALSWPLGLLLALPASYARAGAGDTGSPLWESAPVVTEEPVVFIRRNEGMQPRGTLLFEPLRLLRAYSSDHRFEYPVSDFVIQGREIAYTGSGSLPMLSESELILDEKTPNSFEHYTDGKRYLLYLPNGGLSHYQICFDYETDDDWDGPVPDFKPESLPRFQQKIAQGDPVCVVFLGDSISAGGDASGHVKKPPYTPPYTEQFAERLRAASGHEVSTHNLSKGGQSSPWAVSQAESAAAFEPDLLVIAFGMNDASWSGIPVEDYAENIRSAMDTVRKNSPKTEFILVSPMTPNPSWSRFRADLRAAYHEKLLAMSGPGVVVCDVRSPWLYLTGRKNFLSLSGNGLNHPNDYGHRLYADVLSESVLGPSAWKRP
jgi:lysophospholipase L1-like esterase